MLLPKIGAAGNFMLSIPDQQQSRKGFSGTARSGRHVALPLGLRGEARLQFGDEFYEDLGRSRHPRAILPGSLSQP